MKINYISNDLEVRQEGNIYFIWSGRACYFCSFEDILLTSLSGDYHLSSGQLDIVLNRSEFDSLSSMGFEVDVITE